jgi:N-acetylglucosamine repressor
MNPKQGQIRADNIQKVIETFRDSPGCTVSQIVERTKISRATVAKILQNLRSKRVVLEDGVGSSTSEGGKPPKLYVFDPISYFAIGMHLSMDSLFGKLVDLNIHPRASVSFPIDRNLGIEALLSVMQNCIAELIRQSGVHADKIVGLGVGSHGVIDDDRGAIITSPHFPSWGNDLRIRELIRKRVENRFPIYVDNAIRYRLLAEKSLGLLQRETDGIVVYSEEGLIAGVLVDGSIRRGVHNLAGSVGHMKINPGDPEQCDCGGYGCFEMQIKPSRIVSRTIRELPNYPNSILNQCHGSEVSIQTIFDASNSNDELAKKMICEAASWFAVGLHNLVLTLDPNIVVIQGIYAGAGDFFRCQLSSQLEQVSLLNAPSHTHVEYSILGEEAASLGAATHVVSHTLG